MRGGQHPLLFELLNEMDGLAEDADIIFLLTTNRAELLEPALAARPGQIDQAVELPLPDADCSAGLLDLYRGAPAGSTRADLDPGCRPPRKASPRRFLRSCSAARPWSPPRTPPPAPRHRCWSRAATSTEALAELQSTRNAMTRALLGSAAADV